MRLSGIYIKGWKIDKDGNFVPNRKRLDVSTRLKQKNSKRVRVVKRRTA